MSKSFLDSGVEKFDALTDAEWDRVKIYIPECANPITGRGRRPVNSRSILDGAIWVLTSGEPWRALPLQYPSYKTCHRRWKSWQEKGVFDDIVSVLFDKASERRLRSSVSRRMRRGK